MINPTGDSKKYAIISVVGIHANEEIDHIFVRKIEEIRRSGKTYWAYRSTTASPKTVQEFGLMAAKEKNTVACLFIEASGPGATNPTKGSEKALFLSSDKESWNKIPDNNLITGSGRSSFALVLDRIDLMDNTHIDLWKYSRKDSPGKAIRMILGSSTICSIKHSSEKDESKMKSRYRRLLAVGRLIYPYGVWLKY